MQRFCIAVLLCSVAFVAYAAARSEAAAAEEPNKHGLTPAQAMKILAQDSSAASYAFDKETYVQHGSDSGSYGYTHRKKRSHKKRSSPAPAYKGYEWKDDTHDDDEYKSVDNYKKDSYDEDYSKSYKKEEHKKEHKSEPDSYSSEDYTKKKEEHKEHKHSHGDDYKEEHKKDKDGDKDSYKNSYKNTYKKDPEYKEEHKKDSYKNSKDADYKEDDKKKDGYKNGKDADYKDGDKKKDTKKDGKKYTDKEDSYEENSDYHKGVKVCLQEVKRTPAAYPDPTVLTTEWRSDFACCEDIAKKNEYKLDDSIAPDASKLAEMLKPVTPIGYCNWTAASELAAPSNSVIEGRVGTAYASCEITAASSCFPLPKGSKFTTDTTPNYSHWLQVPAALSNKRYVFGVYTAGAAKPKAAVAAVEPAAAKPVVTYDDEYEYEYQPSVIPIPAVIGAADHFAAMLASSPNLLKGGSLHYTAGFVDKYGKVICPADTGLTVSKPTVEGTHLPIVKCGEYKLRLWLAPTGDGPYKGYDGKWNYPAGKEPKYDEYESYYGEEEYYKKDGPYADGYYTTDGSYHTPDGSHYYKPDGSGPYKHGSTKDKPVDYHYQSGAHPKDPKY